MEEKSSWTFGILCEGIALIELLSYKHTLSFKKRKNDFKGRAVRGRPISRGPWSLCGSREQKSKPQRAIFIPGNLMGFALLDFKLAWGQ